MSWIEPDQRDPATIVGVEVGYSTLEDRIQMRLKPKGESRLIIAWLPQRVIDLLQDRLIRSLRGARLQSKRIRKGNQHASIRAIEHLLDPGTAKIKEQELSAYLISETWLDVRAGRLYLQLLGYPLPEPAGVAGIAQKACLLELTPNQGKELMWIIKASSAQGGWPVGQSRIGRYRRGYLRWGKS
ncbi:hypothetical protein LRD18_10450 [Halorhodospira halochloris]|uniref:hypothetical protein n=1 Tax=Halorhodospira halochloris TaxID=1052 RepID=UPI001EE8C56F|nr:hypothetical protein [Halorhodospira halochloris]MCG5531275.1 hypothetical protein [Halorhodospira halochloris]